MQYARGYPKPRPQREGPAGYQRPARPRPGENARNPVGPWKPAARAAVRFLRGRIPIVGLVDLINDYLNAPSMPPVAPATGFTRVTCPTMPCATVGGLFATTFSHYNNGVGGCCLTPASGVPVPVPSNSNAYTEVWKDAGTPVRFRFGHRYTRAPGYTGPALPYGGSSVPMADPFNKPKEVPENKPSIVPTLDPPSIPIARPGPDPLPLPYRDLPHVVPSPWSDPHWYPEIPIVPWPGPDRRVAPEGPGKRWPPPRTRPEFPFPNPDRRRRELPRPEDPFKEPDEEPVRDPRRDPRQDPRTDPRITPDPRPFEPPLEDPQTNPELEPSRETKPSPNRLPWFEQWREQQLTRLRTAPQARAQARNVRIEPNAPPKPTRRGEVQKKFIANVNNQSPLGKIANAITEGVDVVDCLWDNLPKWAQTRVPPHQTKGPFKSTKPRLNQRMKDIYEFVKGSEVDMLFNDNDGSGWYEGKQTPSARDYDDWFHQSLLCIAWEQIKDAAYARASKALSRAFRRATGGSRPVGPGTGPAI